MTAAARKTQPTRSLLEGMAYTSADNTDIRRTFARAMLQQAQQEPDSLAPLLIASIELARAKKEKAK